MTFGNGRFVAAGAGGLFLESDPEPPQLPQIGLPLRSAFTIEGSSTSLSTWVVGSAPESVTFQWFKDGEAMPGATNNVLQFTNTQPSDSGSYQVEVSNDLGTTKSLPGGLTVESRFDPLNRWHLRRSDISTDSLGRLAFGKGLFVAVTVAGELRVSNDATHWTSPLPPGFAPVARVRYLNDSFVAVGKAGLLLSSSDGDNWTVHILPKDADLCDASFGSGLYAFVGQAGTILIGPDLDHLTKQLSGSQADLFAVAIGPESMIAAGAGGEVLFSHDGTEWLRTTTKYPQDFTAAAYGDGIFVLGGSSETALSSKDGERWSFLGEAGPCVEAIVAGGIALAGDLLTKTSVGGGSTGTGYGFPLLGMAMCDSNLGVTGYGSTILGLDPIRYGTNFNFRAICYGRDRFVCVGTAGRIFTSSNGAEWSEANSGTISWLYGVAASPDGFVAVGSGGTILTSADGLSWQQQSSGTKLDLNRVAWAMAPIWPSPVPCSLLRPCVLRTAFSGPVL